MFTTENTDGFSGNDLDLMNAALQILIARGVDEGNAADIVNNNWTGEGDTVASLAGIDPAVVGDAE